MKSPFNMMPVVVSLWALCTPACTHRSLYAQKADEARALMEQGRHADAVESAREALAFAQKEYEPEHPDRLRAGFLLRYSLRTLAAAHEKEKRWEDAERLYRELAAILERKVNPDPRRPAKPRSKISIATFDADTAVEPSSAPTFDTRLSEDKETPKERYERFKSQSLVLDKAYRSESEVKKARESERLKGIWRLRMELAYTLMVLGRVQLNADRLEQARATLERALELQESLMGPAAEPVTGLRKRLAALLLRMARQARSEGRCAEAMPFYRRAAELLADDPGVHPDQLELLIEEMRGCAEG
jgi:tetratricopeptide (TPR) repeat protein